MCPVRFESRVGRAPEWARVRANSRTAAEKEDYPLKVHIKVIAAVIALGGFVVALLAGMLVGNPPHITLFKALVALVICQFLGICVGYIGTHIIADHLEAHKAKTPIPSLAVSPIRAASSSPTDETVVESV